MSSLFLCRAKGTVNDKGSEKGSTLNRYVLRGQQEVGVGDKADVAQ